MAQTDGGRLLPVAVQLPQLGQGLLREAGRGGGALSVIVTGDLEVAVVLLGGASSCRQCVAMDLFPLPTVHPYAMTG